MKKVIGVTLGSSQKDFEFTSDFLGQEYSIKRVGTDGDTAKAWELMRRYQARGDAIGLGEVTDHYHVGVRTIENKTAKELMHVVTRVPVTTGAMLRRLLQVRQYVMYKKSWATTSTTTWCCFFPACATTTWRLPCPNTPRI